MDSAFVELGVPAPPRYNSRAVTGAYLAMRGEVLHLAELRRQHAARSAQRVDTKRKTPAEGQAAAKRQKVATGKR